MANPAHNPHLEKTFLCLLLLFPALSTKRAERRSVGDARHARDDGHHGDNDDHGDHGDGGNKGARVTLMFEMALNRKATHFLQMYCPAVKYVCIKNGNFRITYTLA